MLIHAAFIPDLAKALDMNEERLSTLIAKKRKRKSRYLPIKKNLTLTSPILINLIAFKKQRIKVCNNETINTKISLINKVLNAVRWQNVKGEEIVVEKCRKRRVGQGVVLQQDTQRYYPKSASMAPLLGRVNAENKGGV